MTGSAHVRSWGVAAVLSTALVSQASVPRVVVGPFKGVGTKKAQYQVEDAVCESFECVDSRGEADLLVSGQVSKASKRKPRTLLLTVLGRDDVVLKKSLPLRSSGHVASWALRTVVKQMQGAFGEPLRKPVEVVAPPPPADELKTPPALAPDPPALPKSSKVEAPPEPAPSTLTRSVAPAPAGPDLRGPWLVLEVGSDGLSRKFGFLGEAPTHARGYEAPLLFGPHARLELRPVRARVGLRLEGDFTTALGARAKNPDTGALHATRLWQLDVGGRLAARPFSRSRFAVGLGAGYRLGEFAVAPGRDGESLDRLPGMSYRVVRAVGSMEVPFTEAVGLFGEAAYLHVLSLGDLSSSGYFPGTRAAGLEAQAGLMLGMGGGFELRVSGRWTAYAFSFPLRDGLPRTQGAVDQYLGGALNLRYAL